MRDWLISRQRYWGTPIPIVYCEQCGQVPVSAEQLPIRLPCMKEYQPDGSGRSPLGRVPEFVNTICPACSGPARRETDTMGGFACSSWYFLRFTSPQETRFAFNDKAMEYWMPVDLYVGGAEHATLHLLYARFWTKVLADAGYLPFREPFIKLKNQGQLLAPDGQRMSKSRHNTITPDIMVDQFGADALRIYSMFMAPFSQDIAWNTQGMVGARRFLNRIWGIYHGAYAGSSGREEDDAELATAIHITIRQVSGRIEAFRFNTMISALMEFLNLLSDRWQNNRWQTKTFHEALEVFMVLLAPSAPHIAEELWQLTGHQGSVHQQQWPTWDEDLVKEDTIEIAIQVNGKVKQVIRIAKSADTDEINDLVRNSQKIQQAVDGCEIVKTVYVPGKIYNIVTIPQRTGG
jgi:leucyl-tRNA synthetase